jgi:DUF4097 and DUF4098 domain-containing protein YvlB
VIEHQFSVGNAPAIKIAIRSGRVVVEPGEPDVITITVDTRDPTFEIQQRGDTIVASGERGGRAFVSARVPPLVDVDVSTASADIQVVPAVGRLEIGTASGDLEFDTATRLQVKSASGSIAGNGVDGEARCLTASGDIRISRIGERANLSTASGDIFIDVCEGELIVATVSGDMRVAELTGPSVNAKSMSGSVRIGVLPRTRLDLDATTLSGKVKLPPPSPHPEPPEREIGAKVRLVSGDLTILRHD